MTDRYQKIRDALAMGPTPGPYKADQAWRGFVISSNNSYDIAVIRDIGPENNRANAEHIAACDPDTILKLLDDRDELLVALEQLVKVHRLAFGLEGALDREYTFAEHVIKRANG